MTDNEISKLAHYAYKGAECFGECPREWPSYEAFLGFQIGKYLSTCEENLQTDDINKLVRMTWALVERGHRLECSPTIEEIRAKDAAGDYECLGAQFERDALAALGMRYHPKREEILKTVNAVYHDGVSRWLDNLERIVALIKEVERS